MNSRTMYATWGLTALTAMIGGWLYSQRALNHDAGTYLLMARALVDGRVLYESFPDYSMPANAWLGMISLSIANLSGATLAYVQQGVFFLLTAAGAVVTGHITSRACAVGSVAGFIMPPLIMGLFLIIPGFDMGQRDVLFGVLAAPLVAIVAARHFGVAPGWFLSILIAVLAAIGASFKPQVGLPLLVLGASELALRRGRLQAVARELWLLAALLVLYIIVVQLTYPTYFTQVLPGATKMYAYMAVWIVSVLRSLTMAVTAGFIAALLLLAILVHRIRSRRPIPWGMLIAWAALAVALALMATLQRQGLRYHTVPLLLYALTSVCLFAAINIDDAMGRWHVGSRSLANTRMVVATVGALAIIVMAARSYAPEGLTRTHALTDPVTRMLRSLPPATYVLAFQTGVLPISPLHAYADIRWSGEFSEHHQLAALVYDRDAAIAHGRPRDPFFVALEQHIREAALRSLTIRPPEIVLVDVSRPLRWFDRYGGDFDLLSWFKQDPAFVAAWSAYELVETVQSFGGVPVEIWRRRAALARSRLTSQSSISRS